TGTEDIEDKGSFLIVKISDTETNRKRTFTIPNKMDGGFNPAKIHRKCAALRPKNVPHRRCFHQYGNGKSTVQMARICQFHTYLTLPHSKGYTGHSFTRSLASLLGYDILRSKRDGGWKSSNVSESCVQDRIE
ncbi:hypothetical protein BDFB_011464, partial [Asbolus verrucosus]